MKNHGNNAERESLFEDMYDQFGIMVHNLCLGYVKGSKEQARDLSQEIFANVWSALDSFRADSSYKTWVYRIAVNTCLKHLRDSAKGETVFVEAIDPHYTGEELTIERAKNSLYRAIGKLSKIDRLIIMMVLEDLDYSVIADVLGIKKGNLRVKIHRIKKNLRGCLNYEY